jgi:hypothetical protein
VVDLFGHSPNSAERIGGRAEPLLKAVDLACRFGWKLREEAVKRELF